MKNIFRASIAVTLLFIMLFATACEKKEEVAEVDPNGPQATVLNFYDSWKKGDIYNIPSFFASEDVIGGAMFGLGFIDQWLSKISLEAGQEFDLSKISSDINLEIIKEEIDGDKAVVSVKCDIVNAEYLIESFGAETSDDNKFTERVSLEGDIPLSLVDGKWLIDIEEKTDEAKFFANTLTGNLYGMLLSLTDA